MKTKVIFRKFISNGEVIALFPALAANGNPAYCLSYVHAGQHGAASADLHYCTVKAAPSEFGELAKELEAIGYQLEISSRFSPKDYSARVSQL